MEIVSLANRMRIGRWPLAILITIGISFGLAAWVFLTTSRQFASRDAAARLESAGAGVEYESFCPQWLEPLLRKHFNSLEFFERPVEVEFGWDIDPQPYPENVLEDVSHLRHLQSLKIPFVRASDADLVFLSGLRKLRELELTGTRFLDVRLVGDGLVHLRRARNLEELDLSQTNVNDRGLRHLSGLTNLNSLNFDQTDVTDTGLAHLSKLINLEEMSLQQTRVTGAGFANFARLSKLKKLNLTGTQVDRAGLAHLGKLNSLETLDLYGTRVDDAALASLATLPNLKELDLSRTRVQGLGLRHLAQLGNLEQLAIFQCPITDDDLAHLSQQTSLRILRLEETRVTDAGLAHLVGMKNLETLELSHSPVGDEGLKHLSALSNLQGLVLSGTLVSDAGAQHLQHLPSLHSLDLYKARISYEAFETIRQRVGPIIPDWWRQRFLAAQGYRRTNVFFQRMNESLYHEPTRGLKAPRGTSLQREDDGIVLSMGEQVIALPQAMLDAAYQQSLDPGLSALFTKDRCFVAIHPDDSFRYPLVAIDLETGQAAWKTEVWTGHASGGGTGSGYWHWVTLRQHDGHIIVFGMSIQAAYIEAFDANDGDVGFRFSTNW